MPEMNEERGELRSERVRRACSADGMIKNRCVYTNYDYKNYDCNILRNGLPGNLIVRLSSGKARVSIML